MGMIYRDEKGSKLTKEEVDENFRTLEMTFGKFYAIPGANPTEEYLIQKGYQNSVLNTNTFLEKGDLVFLKKVVDTDSQVMYLYGHEYLGGLINLRENYQAKITIEIS